MNMPEMNATATEEMETKETIRSIFEKLKLDIHRNYLLTFTDLVADRYNMYNNEYTIMTRETCRDVARNSILINPDNVLSLINLNRSNPKVFSEWTREVHNVTFNTTRDLLRIVNYVAVMHPLNPTKISPIPELVYSLIEIATELDTMFYSVAPACFETIVDHVLRDIPEIQRKLHLNFDTAELMGII